jgi:hypothetical protein
VPILEGWRSRPLTPATARLPARFSHRRPDRWTSGIATYEPPGPLRRKPQSQNPSSASSQPLDDAHPLADRVSGPRCVPPAYHPDRQGPVPTGCHGSGPVLGSARVSSKVRAGDRGRTDDLVLGKRIDSGHHTISAHRTQGNLRVPRPWTAHRMGSIRTQSGTHPVHTSSRAYAARRARRQKRCAAQPAPERAEHPPPRTFHCPALMNRRDARPGRAWVQTNARNASAPPRDPRSPLPHPCPPRPLHYLPFILEEAVYVGSPPHTCSTCTTLKPRWLQPPDRAPRGV